MDSTQIEEIRKKANSNCKSFSLDQTSDINNDIEASLSTTVTLEAMNVCNAKIIRPFNIMLTMVGWRSLMTQFQKTSLVVRVVDKVILLLFIFLLIYSYVYNAVACRFEININDKLVTIGPELTTPKTIQNTSTTIRYFAYRLSTTPERNNSENYETYILCSHISTTYIIPSLIHFIAYILGMIHYRINDNEDIYGLMEKALQYSATLGTKRKNYSRVTNMLTFWMFLAFFWILLSIVSFILYDLAFNTFASPFYVFRMNRGDDQQTKNIKHFMFLLDFFGFLIACVVTVTIVLNYTIYCELIKFYVDAISKKIETRCIKINVIKSDIQNVDGSISLINGMIGKITTLIFILELNLLIVGIVHLMSCKNNSDLEVAYRFFYVIHMVPIILTAIIQSVRVNLSLKAFQQWAMHMSVFGYRKESRKQLDSFLLFTMGYSSKVQLMAYPLEWWQVLLFIIMLGLIFITLIQTGALDKVPVFKSL